MAEEFRILRGDTYDVIVTIRDKMTGGIVPIAAGGWSVDFESDTISKNSVDNPTEFIIEQAPYTVGQVVINLTSEETDPESLSREHFKVRLYQDTNPTLRKTVATGDLFFINEA